jgi:hypothetical protein
MDGGILIVAVLAPVPRCQKAVAVSISRPINPFVADQGAAAQ